MSIPETAYAKSRQLWYLYSLIFLLPWSKNLAKNSSHLLEVEGEMEFVETEKKFLSYPHTFPIKSLDLISSKWKRCFRYSKFYERSFIWQCMHKTLWCGCYYLSYFMMRKKSIYMLQIFSKSQSLLSIHTGTWAHANCLENPWSKITVCWYFLGLKTY